MSTCLAFTGQREPTHTLYPTTQTRWKPGFARFRRSWNKLCCLYYCILGALLSVLHSVPGMSRIFHGQPRRREQTLTPSVQRADSHITLFPCNSPHEEKSPPRTKAHTQKSWRQHGVASRRGADGSGAAGEAPGGLLMQLVPCSNPTFSPATAKTL